MAIGQYTLCNKCEESQKPSCTEGTGTVTSLQDEISVKEANYLQLSEWANNSSNTTTHSSWICERALEAQLGVSSPDFIKTIIDWLASVQSDWPKSDSTAYTLIHTDKQNLFAQATSQFTHLCRFPHFLSFPQGTELPNPPNEL